MPETSAKTLAAIFKEFNAHVDEESGQMRAGRLEPCTRAWSHSYSGAVQNAVLDAVVNVPMKRCTTTRDHGQCYRLVGHHGDCYYPKDIEEAETADELWADPNASFGPFPSFQMKPLNGVTTADLTSDERARFVSRSEIAAPETVCNGKLGCGKCAGCKRYMGMP